MNSPLHLLKRIQESVATGTASRSDELDRLLADLHASLEQAEQENSKLRVAQAEAIVSSAAAISELEDTHAELEDALKASVQSGRELQLQKERYRAILENTVDAVITINGQGLIEEFSYAAEEMFGYAAQDLLGKNISELMPAPYRDLHDGYLARYLAEGDSRESPIIGKVREAVGRRRDGTTFPLQIAVSRVIYRKSQTSDQDVVFTGIIRDLTEQKKVEADLIKAREVAELANNAKSDFLANMSHEIRTPLNGIIGFADLLIEHGEQLGAEQRQDYLSCIQASGRHLLTLINDILDLSKIESEHLELEHLDYSPHDLLAEVISVLRVRAAEKGIELTFEWSGPVPKTIRTDPTRLRQTLMNLTGNAIKFTEQGAVRLIASIESADDGQSTLRVDVVDTGIGIPKDKQQTIFTPFSQADNSVTRRFGGTGLGLSISRRLASAMGGDITVESEPGAGSCFSLTIDAGDLSDVEMLKAPPTDAIASSQQADATADDESRLSGVRVLLAEDGLINQKLITALLMQAGAASVDLAENGAIAVEQAEAQSYDVILMDMQMPVVDGYAAAGMLRDRGHHTPIIALTAHAMKGDRERCLEAGCTDYVTKPIVAEELIRHVASWVQPDSGSPKDQPSVSDRDSRYESRISSTLPTNDPVFQEIVQDFGQLLDDSLPRMRRAARDRDASALRKLAHDLVGTAGGAGFDGFTKPGRQLEQYIETEQYDEIMQSLRLLDELAMRVDIPTEEPAAAW
jgi:PAS domain S-box-containing protein